MSESAAFQTKVYALVKSFPYEGDAFCGIVGTREEAEAYTSSHPTGADREIVEVGIGETWE